MGDLIEKAVAVLGVIVIGYVLVGFFFKIITFLMAYISIYLRFLF